MGLEDIFYEIKPELKDIGDLHGKKIIDDMKFDSVDVVELLSLIEAKLNMEVDNIEEMLDIIQEYDALEEWFAGRSGKHG